MSDRLKAFLLVVVVGFSKDTGFIGRLLGVDMLFDITGFRRKGERGRGAAGDENMVGSVGKCEFDGGFSSVNAISAGSCYL